MPSNFDFLQQRFPSLFEHASQAERLVFSAPRASCFYARFTLEQTVHWLYDNDPGLQLPYDNNLAALIHEQSFKDNLKPGLFQKIRIIHTTGNRSAHEASPITQRDAFRVAQELFHFLYWLCRFYAPDGRNLPKLEFDRDLLPQADSTRQDISFKQVQELQAQLSQADEMRRIAEERRQQSEAQLAELKAQIDALKAQNETVPDTHDYNEADTRRYLIDVLLKEAGWPIEQPGWTEVEVQGMPTDTGTGYVDYVLWGDNGKPLALVEAKRTRNSPTAGKQQAKLYADCLEAKFGQRPIIFYTNGYETWIWDDAQYPPRRIDGFLKKLELERAIFRRAHRKPLHLVPINAGIVNRSYQQEAIRRIAETFQKNARKTLLVMATGTGKTRTAIALVDLLMQANWVKRVLFLADRTALLTQTLRVFKSQLPDATVIDLTKDPDAESANVVLSTYPTMLNRINRNQGTQRLFGPGYFDLVIVDEAHRSIYKKYSALFQYFDSLLVGLTATPRTEVHRDTYRIFELEQGNPTFAYELSDAIDDRYLVPPKGVKVPFKFMRKGVRYADLTPAEQEEYEEKFRDEETGEIPDRVNAAALYRWLFNESTVDQALEILMERGLKVDGGDRLGKTIIFARSHKHAEYIVERFDHNYPHLKGQFAQIIDSHDSYAQSLLDAFSDPAKQPTIAVSVDMLDTGVDVPEVVNLVFFKPVYSQVKFNQMIGRGTRLCHNLFGPGEHKQAFLVFDLCSNFEFFAQEVAEANQRPAESITSRLVKARLTLAQTLSQPDRQNDPDQAALRDGLLNDLHQHVTSMERENFLVRRHLRQVEEFADRERWERLDENDIEAITETLAPLPNTLPSENALAKRFDLLCFNLQITLLRQSPDFIRLRDKVRDVLTQLEEKRDIPMVKAQLTLIEEAQNESYWTDITLPMIEQLRLKLRDLIRFVERTEQPIIYTDFIDELGEIEEIDIPLRQPGFSPYQYRKKVEAYIKENENHVAIAKLKRNISLTEADLASLETMLFGSEEIESRDRFEEVYGKDLSLKLFIRQLVGCDRNAAKQAFSRYLEGGNLSANQIRFVETIIDYLTQKGVMDLGQLYEAPFSDFHSDGLDGVFKDADADQIITIIRSFNDTVGFQFSAA
ncbi:DEAD/DEAH box helicase family protein [Pseudanabaena sp. FACHB-2040]|uniref:DEAD/DEAH box helicase family protein n=1 Tax=Pseudanabaena sp. FACHB-2040 TaxID=2692859 RepID=UPI0016851F38|nr:DEAD/DEAH box helicase family protein [Pseudanabaena sp. FACHB-2040]MBD2261137.1 DEAD/DEAH box helicase family protein [Pseudanabaena sp. FACHB-2040]